MAGKCRTLGVAAQPPRVQVSRETVRPLEDLRVGIPSFALDDQLAIANCGRDGSGDGGYRELCCGVGHQAYHGWCGSKRTIRPLASVSSVPSAAVMVAVTNAFLPSISAIRP